MRRPFANAAPLLPTMPVRTDNGITPAHVGGAAPQGVTLGVRRDIFSVPQFLPSLTITGGLRQPPRG